MDSDKLTRDKFNFIICIVCFILQSMEWREENKIDILVDKWQPSEVLKKYYSMGETGFDKFGCNGIQKLTSLAVKK